MKPEPEQPECRWTDRRVEAYADGDLSPDDRRRVERHAEACGACGELLDSAAAVKHALGALPSLRCPDRVVAAVEEAAAVETAAEPAEARRSRGAVVVALAASLLIAVALRPEPAPSEAEQVEQALAELTERASGLGRDTFERSLVRPARTVAGALRESQLGRWGAAAAGLLTDSRDAEPADTT